MGFAMSWQYGYLYVEDEVVLTVGLIGSARNLDSICDGVVERYCHDLP